MKNFFAILLAMTLLFCGSASCLQVNAAGAPMEEKNYEVYNGYGELIYVADSLEEAEQYLNAALGMERDARGAFLAAMTYIAYLNATAHTIKVVGCVTYEIDQYYLGEAEVKYILTQILSPSRMDEIIAAQDPVYLYSRSASLLNPYPQNSYQGAMWYKNNYYVIV